MEFQASIERANLPEIKTFQEEKLKELLCYLQEHSLFYQNLFAEHQINISEIQTLEDLQKIPVTTKNDLQQFNYDFFCVSKDKIVD